MSDDLHPAYIRLCTEYEELREQQRTYPSQWGEIEKEKAVIRDRLNNDFKDCQFAPIQDDAFMRSHHQPQEPIPTWAAFCIFVGVILFIVALSLDYFDVLVEKL